MRAALRNKYGSAEVIELTDIPMPSPASDEVLVKVHATTVNRTDCGVLTGKPLIFRLFIGFTPKRKILGTDFSGTVAAIGSDVRSFQVGEAVWGLYDEGLQSQAQYMLIKESGNMLTAPELDDHAHKVAALEGAFYATNFINKVSMHPGDKVLINGATGAIGSAALQFLKADGMYVTAVCNTKNIELIKRLGADKIYDYEKEDFTKDVEKYKFIFDAVGKSSFGKCKPLLQKDGIYISSELGPRNENPFLALWTSLRPGKKVIFPIPKGIKESMEQIRERLESGSFVPVIDRTYPFAEVTDAYRYTASGQKTGNVILQIV